MRKLRLIQAIFLLIISLPLPLYAHPITQPYLVLIGASKETLMQIQGVTQLVIDADDLSNEDIRMLHKRNRQILSYLNIGAIERFRDGWTQMLPFTLGPYENWPDERWGNPSRVEWQNRIIQKAESLYQKGIDGLFLDNTDVYALYPRREIYQGLVALIRRIRRPNRSILINGGDCFVKQAIQDGIIQELADGVNQECVFTRIRFSDKTYGAQTPEDQDYFEQYLATCRSAGLSVYLLEYAADKRLAQRIQHYCEKNGFTFFISPSLELDTP